MMVKPISMTISTRPPISPGATMSLVSVAERRRAGGDHPDDEQEPGRESASPRGPSRAPPVDRMSRKPIAVTVAIEMRATPAATGAL